jgi:hypothetical protein
MWGDAQEQYQQVYESDQQPHEAKFSHEAIAGAGAFAAFKAFEDHQRKEGKPINHQFAKELLVGFAGAEVDRLAETKGEDWFDKERSKHEAKKRAEQLYDHHYGGQDQYDPNQPPPRELQDQFGGQSNW